MWSPNRHSFKNLGSKLVLVGIFIEEIKKSSKLNFLIENYKIIFFCSNYYFLNYVQLNCAGILKMGSIETMSIQDCNLSMNINVKLTIILYEESCFK